MPLPRGRRAARTARHEGENMTRAKSDLIDQYLEVLWDRKASDLLLTAGAPPLLRIDGMLTPMAGLAALIPEEVERMVLGILSEDLIEYVHRHHRSAVNQREVGEDTHSFSRALRSALREDPDVLLIGEMRDLETIRIALTVAETGHLVFATLHTNDTAQALDRIVDVFPAEQQGQIRVQLANSLQAVYYQQLLPRIGGGRVAAFEILLANHAVRHLIKEGKSNHIRNVVLTAQREGMQTLEVALSELIAHGVIDAEIGRLRSMYPSEIKVPVAVAANGEGPQEGA